MLRSALQDVLIRIETQEMRVSDFVFCNCLSRGESSEICFDCMKAVVPFVLLLAVGQRMWAQAMVMGAIVFHSLPPVPAYADQLLPYRLGIFISSPQTLAEAPIDSAGANRFGRY